MGKYTGYQLVTDFLERIRRVSDYQVLKTDISRNVFKLIGGSKLLIYIKGRGELPYKWGVTKNVIHRLENQVDPWFVVLLFDTPETGYLLSRDEVNYYISGIWPLGSDGDYKPATGLYLSKNLPFNSINVFLNQIITQGVSSSNER